MDSSTLLVIIVLAHFVIGFGLLVYKLSGKPATKEEEQSEQAS